MDCVFCKIAKKEINAYTIFEDESVCAFLDIHPLSLGHSVVISKMHAENIIDLPLELVAPVFLGVQQVTKIIKKTLNPDGFTIGINHGKWAGQDMDHLHIHIIPRWKDDNGRSIHSVVKNPPTELLTETKNRIINNEHGN